MWQYLQPSCMTYERKCEEKKKKCILVEFFVHLYVGSPTRRLFLKPIVQRHVYITWINQPLSSRHWNKAGIGISSIYSTQYFPHYWPFVWELTVNRSPVNSTYDGQRRGALMFSLTYAWINDWVNTRDSGDLRRHCSNYDVTVTTQMKVVLVCWVVIPQEDCVLFPDTAGVDISSWID